MLWPGILQLCRAEGSAQNGASVRPHAKPSPELQARGKVHKTLALQYADELSRRWCRSAEIQTGRVNHIYNGVRVRGVERAKEGVGVLGDNAVQCQGLRSENPSG